MIAVLAAGGVRWVARACGVWLLIGDGVLFGVSLLPISWEDTADPAG